MVILFFRSLFQAFKCVALLCLGAYGIVGIVEYLVSTPWLGLTVVLLGMLLLTTFFFLEGWREEEIRIQKEERAHRELLEK